MFWLLYFITAIVILGLYRRGNRIFKKRVGILSISPLFVICFAFLPIANFVVALLSLVAWAIAWNELDLDPDYEREKYERKLRWQKRFVFKRLNKFFNIKE